jgi:transposase
MRAGTRTELKKRWTPKKHRPCGRFKLGYEFVYLYAALCPYNGDLIALLLPHMTLECFEIFARYFQQQTQIKYGQVPVALIHDQASCHQAPVLEGSQITMIPLPTACPELNPAERFFEELRKDLSNQVFETIQQVEDLLCDLLQKYWQQPPLISQLTLFPYINTSP